MASKERAAHVLSAPVMRFGLPAQLAKLKWEDQWRLEGRNAITLLKTSELCVVLLALKKGVRMEAHQIEHPLTLQVIDGALHFGVGEEPLELETGSLLTLEKNAVHDLVATRDCGFLLTIVYVG